MDFTHMHSIHHSVGAVMHLKIANSLRFDIKATTSTTTIAIAVVIFIMDSNWVDFAADINVNNLGNSLVNTENASSYSATTIVTNHTNDYCYCKFQFKLLHLIQYFGELKDQYPMPDEHYFHYCLYCATMAMNHL